MGKTANLAQYTPGRNMDPDALLGADVSSLVDSLNSSSFSFFMIDIAKENAAGADTELLMPTASAVWSSSKSARIQLIAAAPLLFNSADAPQEVREQRALALYRAVAIDAPNRVLELNSIPQISMTAPESIEQLLSDEWADYYHDRCAQLQLAIDRDSSLLKVGNVHTNLGSRKIGSEIELKSGLQGTRAAIKSTVVDLSGGQPLPFSQLVITANMYARRTEKDWTALKGRIDNSIKATGECIATALCQALQDKPKRDSKPVQSSF